MLGNILCVDAGAAQVKLVYGKRRSGRLGVLCSSIMETPHAAMSNGYIEDMGRLAEKIVAFRKDYGLKRPKAAFVACSSDVMVRNLVLPVMPRKAVVEAVENDLRVLLHDAVSDYQIKCRIVRKKGNQYEICCIAAPQKLIEQYAELAEASGLRLLRVETAPICAARLLRDEEEKHMLVDFGRETVRMIYCAGGQVLADRLLQFRRDSLCAGSGDSCLYLEEDKLDYVFRSISQVEGYFSASGGGDHSICPVGGMADHPRIISALNAGHSIRRALSAEKLGIDADQEFKRHIGCFANVLGLLSRKG